MHLGYSSWNLFFTLNAIHIATSNAASFQESSNAIDEDDFDCGLDAANACFEPIMRELNCAFTFRNKPSCGDVELTPMKLERLFRLADEALNGCLVSILGGSCSAVDPIHGYFQQWLKPLNAVLRKLRTEESIFTIAEAFECHSESVFSCLLFFDETNWAELITTSMSPEICGNIELKGQYCLSTTTLPKQCRSLLRLAKNLTQEFVDHASCTEPVILVPFQSKGNSMGTRIPFDGDEYDDDRICGLESTVVSNCFQPMMDQLKCYFSGHEDCGFSLESLCLSTREAFESCSMDLLGYGCNQTEEHHFFYQWLTAFRHVQAQLCGAKESSDFKDQQEIYFNGKASCWMEFLDCLHFHYQNGFVSLITEEMKDDVCRQLSDNVDYCMMVLTQDDTCEPILDKIQAMKNTFNAFPLCHTATPLQVQQTDETSVSGSNRFYLSMLWVLNTALWV